MLLNKLAMRNFKRFRNQEIAFQDGITGIVGNNGTGKSSIVAAVLFALYGLQGTGLDANYIVSSFAGRRTSARSAWTSWPAATNTPSSAGSSAAPPRPSTRQTST